MKNIVNLKLNVKFHLSHLYFILVSFTSIISAKSVLKSEKFFDLMNNFFSHSNWNEFYPFWKILNNIKNCTSFIAKVIKIILWYARFSLKCLLMIKMILCYSFFFHIMKLFISILFQLKLLIQLIVIDKICTSITKIDMRSKIFWETLICRFSTK